MKHTERGATSILIELTGGNIIVKHGTDKIVLFEVENAEEGSWNKIFDCIKNIKSLAKCDLCGHCEIQEDIHSIDSLNDGVLIDVCEDCFSGYTDDEIRKAYHTSKTANSTN